MSIENGRKKYILIAVILGTCLATVFFTFVKPTLSTVKLEYTIKPHSADDQIIGINIRIIRKTNMASKNFSMGKGNFSPSNTKCIDNNGKAILFSEKDDKLVIGPVKSDAKYIDLSYEVKIGDFNGTGYQGAYYDNLIAFNGDNTLYFPYFTYDDDSYNNINRFISEIKIKADVEEGINSVIPYQKKYNVIQVEPVIIKNPDWKVIYNLGKSCYAFGNFDEASIKGTKGDIHVLLDPQYKSNLTEETESLLSTLYDYYADLFGSELKNYPILILRNNPSDANMTVGGIGGKSLGISINPNNSNEVRTLSHSLYSAFFDSKVNSINLHYQPNLWLYKGLATYYENMSLDYLPENIRNKFDFNSSSGFKELYSRYIYFRLKEPVMYKLSPADEKSAMQGQLQFFFYTEAPLVVKTIEEISNTNKKQGALSYLIKHKDDKTINIGELMLDTLGQSEQIIRNYLMGDTILPYSGVVVNKEDPDKIINQLDSYERLLCSWNQQEMPIYPYDKIYLLDPNKLADEIIAKDVKFASDEMEKMVGTYSPTIFMLLKQYKLRADVCSLKDINDPMLKFKLLSDKDNENKWYDYLSKLGVDVDNENDAVEGAEAN